MLYAVACRELDIRIADLPHYYLTLAQQRPISATSARRVRRGCNSGQGVWTRRR